MNPQLNYQLLQPHLLVLLSMLMLAGCAWVRSETVLRTVSEQDYSLECESGNEIDTYRTLEEFDSDDTYTYYSFDKPSNRPFFTFDESNPLSWPLINRDIIIVVNSTIPREKRAILGQRTSGVVASTSECIYGGYNLLASGANVLEEFQPGGVLTSTANQIRCFSSSNLKPVPSVVCNSVNYQDPSGFLSPVVRSFGLGEKCAPSGVKKICYTENKHRAAVKNLMTASVFFRMNEPRLTSPSGRVRRFFPAIIGGLTKLFSGGGAAGGILSSPLVGGIVNGVKSIVGGIVNKRGAGSIIRDVASGFLGGGAKTEEPQEQSQERFEPPPTSISTVRPKIGDIIRGVIGPNQLSPNFWNIIDRIDYKLAGRAKREAYSVEITDEEKWVTSFIQSTGNGLLSDWELDYKADYQGPVYRAEGKVYPNVVDRTVGDLDRLVSEVSRKNGLENIFEWGSIKRQLKDGAVVCEEGSKFTVVGSTMYVFNSKSKVLSFGPATNCGQYDGCQHSTDCMEKGDFIREIKVKEPLASIGVKCIQQGDCLDGTLRRFITEVFVEQSSKDDIYDRLEAIRKDDEFEDKLSYGVYAAFGLSIATLLVNVFGKNKRVDGIENVEMK